MPHQGTMVIAARLVSPKNTALDVTNGGLLGRALLRPGTGAEQEH